MKKYFRKSNIVIFLIFVLLVFLQAKKYFNDIDSLKTQFIRQESSETLLVAKGVEEKFTYLYQAIRTMSLVPGVRVIDRYAKNLDDSTKMTVQQLFNNAFINIKMSEVYILPASIDPDVVDATTQKPEEPIITFDEFVASKDIVLAKKDEDKKPEFPEEEVFEYRLMKKQLQELQTVAATNLVFKDLDVPMVSGPAVITCDNSEYTKADFENKNDEPRMGIVFTVPRYDKNGKFAGGVSAVVRNNVLKSFLEKGRLGLANVEHGISLIDSPSKAWTDSQKYFSQNKKNENLIYSEVVKLNTPDHNLWQISAAVDDQVFWQSESVKQTQNIFGGGVLITFIAAVLLAYQFNKNGKMFEQIRMISERLEQSSEDLLNSSGHLEEVANNLSNSSEKQASASQQAASAAEEIKAMTSKTQENAKKLTTSSLNNVQSANTGKSAVNTSSEVLVEIQKSSLRLSDQVEKNNNDILKVLDFVREIGEKTKLIDDIVFQTKLLSFNASVEAARAGEAGKGFSVVAEEINQLAQQSGNSSRQITELLTTGSASAEQIIASSQKSLNEQIEHLQDHIAQGLKSISDCQTSFEGVLQTSQKVEEMSEEIGQAIAEEIKGIGEIGRSINTFSEETVETANISKNTVSISTHVNTQAHTLSDLVAKLNSVARNSTKIFSNKKKGSKQSSGSGSYEDSSDHKAA